MSTSPPLVIMMESSGAWVALASKYDVTARGETAPAEQMESLRRRLANQQTMISSTLADDVPLITGVIWRTARRT